MASKRERENRDAFSTMMNYGGDGGRKWVSFKGIKDINKTLGITSQVTENIYGCIDKLVEKEEWDYDYHGYDNYIIRFKYIIVEYYPAGSKRRVDVIEDVEFRTSTKRAFILKNGLRGKTKALVRAAFGVFKN
jgi:hypothetical protein